MLFYARGIRKGKKNWNHFRGTDSCWPAFKDVELDFRFQTVPRMELKFSLPLSSTPPFSLLPLLYLQHSFSSFLFFFFISLAVIKALTSWSYKMLRSPVTHGNAHLKNVHFPGTRGNGIRQRASPSAGSHFHPRRWRRQALGKSIYHD